MAGRGRPRASLTYEQIQQEILVNKLDVKWIARKYGVSDDTVRRRMKQRPTLRIAAPIAAANPTLGPGHHDALGDHDAVE